EGVEGTPPEPIASHFGAVVIGPDLRADTLLIEFVPKFADGAQFQIPPVDITNDLGLGGVNDQLAVLDHIAKRGDTAHPHAFLLGCRDLVPDLLPGDLTLELGKGEEDVEGKSPHGGGGIELLS